MAQSVPREVIERALRNAPQDQRSGPKFGTWAWRSQNIAGTGSITIPPPSPITILRWFATGRNQEGQLGLGPNEDIYASVYSTFMPLSANWSSVSLGGDFTMALSGNRLYGTGYNANGQLGINTGGDDLYDFTLVDGQWNKVVAGVSQSYALSGKTLFATGRNSNGSFGNNTTVDSAEFIQLTGQWDNVFTSGNSEYVFALSGKQLWAAGKNASGQLGLGFASTLIPFGVINFTPLTGQWDRVVTSVFNTFALSGKKVYVTGGNQNGSLGIGSTAQVNILTPLTGEWDEITAGRTFTYAKSGDRWFGCGNGTFIGSGGVTNRTSFVPLTGQWSKIVAGDQYAFALSGNQWFVIGSLFSGVAGQSNLDNVTVSVFTPTTGRWNDIYCSVLHTFALSSVQVIL